ncbi:MoaD/ThiS family protein [Celerinatantimonas sp. YJH-8]|uniref:MoaD/ThiS family protein n=1 Tax=Celerinatantimonas sp. YJH-8 TaxID=3228714 RepID=UPI0038C60CBF
MITIKVFARLREQVGTSELQWPLEEPMTVTQLLVTLQEMAGYRWHEININQVLCAVNRVQVTADALIQAGDEVAFFPPVTGG